MNDSTLTQHTRSRLGVDRTLREPAAEPSCSTTLHAGLVDQPDLGRRKAGRRAEVAWKHHETCDRVMASSAIEDKSVVSIVFGTGGSVILNR